MVENIPLELTEVMIVITGLGVIVGLIVALFVKDNGFVIVAITLGILLALFVIQEMIVDPPYQVLYQFLFLIGVLGIAIGVGLVTKLVVMKLSTKE